MRTSEFLGVCEEGSYVPSEVICRIVEGSGSGHFPGRGRWTSRQMES